jgi:hypothetical protein
VALMQPPFHITGDPNVDWIIFVVGAVVCLYWLRALRLAREGARLFLRNLAKAVLAFCALIVILTAVRLQTHFQPSQEQFIAGFAALITRRLSAVWLPPLRERPNGMSQIPFRTFAAY